MKLSLLHVESFDKPLKFWKSDYHNNYQTYKFKLLNDEYTTEFIHKNGSDEKGVYELIFLGPDSSLELTDKGNALTIFSTIFSIILHFIKDRNPKGFYFTAKNDVRRSQLYYKLANKIEGAINWNLTTNDDKNERQFLFKKL